ncbi:MAG: hypothetical protein LBN09_09395 [Clostridioides sp.]|jgi:hypothetical protein|nr:hypothetical protein [Clostridioides sp.]
MEMIISFFKNANSGSTSVIGILFAIIVFLIIKTADKKIQKTYNCEKFGDEDAKLDLNHYQEKMNQDDMNQEGTNQENTTKEDRNGVIEENANTNIRDKNKYSKFIELINSDEIERYIQLKTMDYLKNTNAGFELYESDAEELLKKLLKSEEEMNNLQMELIHEKRKLDSSISELTDSIAEFTQDIRAKLDEVYDEAFEINDKFNMYFDSLVMDDIYICEEESDGDT